MLYKNNVIHNIKKIVKYTLKILKCLQLEYF